MSDLDKITQRLKIAELALAHHAAQAAAAAAKRAYHLAWQRFETGDETHGTGDYVHDEERISAHHPQFDEARQATKAEYAFFQAKKREEYAAKRRLSNACRKAVQP
ncbi:MAG: hypothetical protein K2X55_10275 [Burkholderiaceae bacterium]|nr:hypothetical protein [Burkholderiaceae bacterium]